MNDLAVIEAILRNRYRFFSEIRAGVDLGPKIRAMMTSSVLFLLLYGAVIGSQHSLLQALSSALKVPALFLVTVLICLPTLHFFHVLFGASLSIRQNFALILTAITVTSVLLLSFSPVVLFFMISTADYQLFKLLNVAIFAICGAIGLGFLYQGVKMIAVVDGDTGKSRRRMIVLWALLYAFVGTQLAWTLRPFFGAPGLPFEPFRDLGGSFYANVLASIGEILGFFTVRGGGA